MGASGMGLFGAKLARANVSNVHVDAGLCLCTLGGQQGTLGRHCLQACALGPAGVMRFWRQGRPVGLAAPCTPEHAAVAARIRESPLDSVCQGQGHRGHDRRRAGRSSRRVAGRRQRLAQRDSGVGVVPPVVLEGEEAEAGGGGQGGRVPRRKAVVAEVQALQAMQVGAAGQRLRGVCVWGGKGWFGGGAVWRRVVLGATGGAGRGVQMFMPGPPADDPGEEFKEV